MIVNECATPIKSIEIQLLRVETTGCAEGYAKDSKKLLFCSTLKFYLFEKPFKLVTEIQNIQIGEGDVPRSISIPIYMIFPRLFTCPTLCTTNFKIGIYKLDLMKN